MQTHLNVALKVGRLPSHFSAAERGGGLGEKRKAELLMYECSSET